MFSGSKYPKNISFNFEKGSTAAQVHVACEHWLTSSLFEWLTVTQYQWYCRQHSMQSFQDTVGPLIIESPRAKKWVSTGALRALDDPLVVQTKI